MTEIRITVYIDYLWMRRKTKEKKNGLLWYYYHKRDWMTESHKSIVQKSSNNVEQFHTMPLSLEEIEEKKKKKKTPTSAQAQSRRCCTVFFNKIVIYICSFSVWFVFFSIFVCFCTIYIKLIYIRDCKETFLVTVDAKKTKKKKSNNNQFNIENCYLLERDAIWN